MGIKNLLLLLKSITHRKSLSNYKNKRAGIDGYTWLHRSVFCIGDGIFNTPIDITNCIKYLKRRLDTLLSHEITPIFIFDGDKLPMKNIEENKRENRRKNCEKEAQDFMKCNNKSLAISKKIESFDVTPEFAYEFMKILIQNNIEYYVAPYEADAQLAYLSHIKYIDFIITEDSDLIAYGCNCVLLKLGVNKSEPNTGDEILFDDIKKCKEFKIKDFNEDKFLSFCILSGCDYFNIPGVGPKLAQEAINKFKEYNKCIGYIFGKNMIKGSITEIIKRFEKAFLTYRYQVVYCPVQKKFRYFNDIEFNTYPFLEKYKNDLSFLGKINFYDQIEKYVKGFVNPITKNIIRDDNNFINTLIDDDPTLFRKQNNQKSLLNDDFFKKENLNDDDFKNNGLKIKKQNNKKTKRVSEKPRNQKGIDFFVIKTGNENINNKKVLNSIENNNKINDNRNNNLISFKKPKRQFDDLNFKNNDFRINFCINPLSNYDDKNKFIEKELEKKLEKKEPTINTIQKNIYSKYHITINDDDEDDLICASKNIKNLTIINLDNLEENFGFSEKNIVSPKEVFSPSSTMSNNASTNNTNNINNNNNKNIGSYMDYYVPKIENKGSEKVISTNRKTVDKKKVEKEESDEYDLSFDFDNYKNNITSLEKF